MSTLHVENLKGLSSGGNANKVIVPTGQTLIAPDHIIQTVQHLHSATGTTNAGRLDMSAGGGFVDVFSKAITTKVANSKILVLCKCVAHTAASDMRVKSKMLRGSTEIYTDPYGWYGVAGEMDTHTSIHIDSPNASVGTAITYKLQASNVGSAIVYMRYADGGGTCHSSLTLMEIVP
ncbi:MAG: hypothetical protein VXX56_07475 [Pseudomonadota bacterium]|nr:hypothetical protein [Pseudomonadota bacterium]